MEQPCGGPYQRLPTRTREVPPENLSMRTARGGALFGARANEGQDGRTASPPMDPRPSWDGAAEGVLLCLRGGDGLALPALSA